MVERWWLKFFCLYGEVNYFFANSNFYSGAKNKIFREITQRSHFLTLYFEIINFRKNMLWLKYNSNCCPC